jgi:hypothetical protein
MVSTPAPRQHFEHVFLVVTHDHVIPQKRAQGFFLVSELEGEKDDCFQ